MEVLKSDSRMRMIHFTKCQKIWWYFVLVKVNVQIVANAKKADSILKTCSRLLCKYCKCFTKDKEGEDEDTFLSQRYQGFLDGLRKHGLFIIWRNFCFLNILVLCCYLGEEYRGPYAPIWSCRG